MTENSIEKVYSKIDEDLGEDHVRDVVQNLVNVENNQQAFEHLMKLHEQCCAVFAKYPSQTPPVPMEKKGDIKKKRSLSMKR